MSYYGYKPYVSVAKRRQNAEKKMAALRKRGLNIQPVEIEKRTIAKTFWGKAWCDHMESFSDYDNRLPRGRTYVRNGSVCHLDIQESEIEAIVSGSELYNVNISIKSLAKNKWSSIKKSCSGQIGSILDLLGGKLSDGVMNIVCDRNAGLFPLPKEIELNCDCPDWADMCKHIAAVLYGVGARLDQNPEQLFQLRAVDHQQLIDVSAAVVDVTSKGKSKRKQIADSALADVFDIDIDSDISVTAMKKPEAKAKNSKLTSNKPSKPGKPSTKKMTSTTFPIKLTGNSIFKKRQTMNLTLIEFAKKIGVSSAAVSQWENKGRRIVRPREKSVVALRKFWD